jgi:hypothetical protein
LSSHVKAKDIVRTKDQKRELTHGIHASDVYHPNDETYSMTETVYGITRAEENTYFHMLQTVKTLPAICDFVPLRLAAIVDGDLTDTEEIPVESKSSGIEKSYHERMCEIRRREAEKKMTDETVVAFTLDVKSDSDSDSSSEYEPTSPSYAPDVEIFVSDYIPTIQIPQPPISLVGSQHYPSYSLNDAPLGSSITSNISAIVDEPSDQDRLYNILLQRYEDEYYDPQDDVSFMIDE